jgi:uncharacterized membrane protein
MRNKRTFAIALLMLGYPLAVYFGLKHFSIGALGFLFAGFMAARMVSSNHKDPFGIALMVAAIIGIGLNVLAAITADALLMKLYPVVISAVFFGVFASSLVGGETVIAKIAKKYHGHLSPKAVQYTTKVTVVWCLFFVLNGIAAFYTVFWTSARTWALYNGLISYLLMGSLFACEYFFRQSFVLKSGGQG